MRYQRVCIEALAYEVPTTTITTASMETALNPLYRRLGIGRGFLETITGIRARRFWDVGVQPSDVATRAAEQAFARSGVPRDRVQALVSTSVCKDYLEPSVASLVHGNLGLGRGCLNFDVGNACLGFMSGIIVVANMIELGQIDVGMVVAGEGSRAATESTMKTLLQPGADFATFRDNLATLTLGSGAAAMLLVHERLSVHRHRLQGCISLAATEHNRLCVGTATSMKTDPPKLLAKGVELALETWNRTRSELGLQPDRVREFAMHQVGKANHEALCRTLKLPTDRALRVYTEFGNMGACGVPFTVARSLEMQRVREGDQILLMGIGSGLNCAMMPVQW